MSITFKRAKPTTRDKKDFALSLMRKCRVTACESSSSAAAKKFVISQKSSKSPVNKRFTI